MSRSINSAVSIYGHIVLYREENLPADLADVVDGMGEMICEQGLPPDHPLASLWMGLRGRKMSKGREEGSLE